MSKLPSFVTKYFWGDNLDELNWGNHKEYIIKTILEKGDLEAVKWMINKTDQETLKKTLEKKIDSKSRHFWKIYLS